MLSGVPMSWMRGLMHHDPVHVVSGSSAVFTDVDGHSYIDFNHADLSSTVGYGIKVVTDAIAPRMADGAQFLLPVEDSIWVSEELGCRFGPSHWQHTLSASAANTEAIRLSRMATSRDGVLMFDGSYHGHIGKTLVNCCHEEPQSTSLDMARDHGRHTTVVPFNELAASEMVLAKGETACVMIEPALTNVNLILPQDSFIADETHTHMFAFGGLVPRPALGLGQLSNTRAMPQASSAATITDAASRRMGTPLLARCPAVLPRSFTASVTTAGHRASPGTGRRSG